MSARQPYPWRLALSALMLFALFWALPVAPWFLLGPDSWVTGFSVFLTVLVSALGLVLMLAAWFQALLKTVGLGAEGAGE